MATLTDPFGGWQDDLTPEEIYFEEVGQYLEEETEGED